MTNLAPYPTSADDVTADKLARHLAVATQHLHIKTIDAPDVSRDAMGRFVHQWGVLFLLREIQERAGVHQADALARALWESWQDGSHLGEMLWEWLTEYGIDPEAIR
ncbi:hypothetical protein [Paractinoplanes toevensis]|uniref:Uncharacterized protein n=1 Tax=Paractinoplanes toevensis TaxID=571911 RepID=A0A919T5Q6_9ACTN|nr:hypothetical protein [Actinoplanes toevensis]GIM88857.1 hypothetical protein Ato02nite_006500 [Actinoplanes toevensis]